MLQTNDKDQEAQKLEEICDILVAGGYFRARLNIEPFDKILGGMCWSITGSAYDIDLEFIDDMKRGEKVALAEKVVASLQEMECPYAIFPHQISGCDYEALIKVIKWLLTKLKENRDNRGVITRQQGILQFRLQNEGTVAQPV